MNNTLETTTSTKNDSHKTLYTLVLVFGGLALLLIGFIGGQAYEHIHVRQFNDWRDNYQHNFFGVPPKMSGEPMGGMMGLPPMRTHSLLGKILTIDNDKITVQDRDNIEQSIVTDSNTVYRKDNTPATRNDLKTGLQIAIFGQPNDKGQIAAKLIRIFNTNENPLP